MSTPNSSAGDFPLLPGFWTLSRIQNASNEELRAKIKVDVIGFARDFQPPMASTGTDWKCTIELKDPSIKYETYGLKLNIFQRQDEMPHISGTGDIVLVRSVAIQMFRGAVSLLTNHQTRIHVLHASEIPSSTSAVQKVKWHSSPKLSKPPNTAETKFALDFSRQAAELDLPTTIEFQEKATVAVQNLNNKFSLLKDVKPKHFHDLIGEVVKVWDSGGDRYSLYLSDYTANKEFYDYTKPDGSAQNGRDGDDFNCPKTVDRSKNWPGPWGKMTIQITLYDGNAEYARTHLHPKLWVKLGNVQINHGKMGGKLEGFLRGERGLESKYKIQILEDSRREPTQDDLRCIEGIRRHKEYWTKQKLQQKAAQDSGTESGEKRKREEDGDQEKPKKNSKQRRKEERAALEKQIQAKSNLNPLIRCSFPNQLPVPLSTLLKPTLYQPTPSSSPILSPFTNTKYRTTVRVIDFHPPRLVDFAIGRRKSIYNRLPDHSSSSSSSSPSSPSSSPDHHPFPEKEYEWRFSLLVEDASPKLKEEEREKLWLMVGNHDAQCLLNEDATNLREDKAVLGRIQEQLFKLWGDLEERKSASLPPISTQEQDVPMSSFDSLAETGEITEVGAMPDVDSDVEGEREDRKDEVRPKNEEGRGGGKEVDGKGEDELKPKNKAFVCCVKQYGVKVKEKERERMDAGEGWRWQRMFGLFGTVIN